MKKLFFPVLTAFVITSSAFTLASGNSWKLQSDNYTVKFTSSKMEGIFKGLKSEIIFDEANLAEAKITASIDAATVNTGNGMRNKHARQGLGAEQYPAVRFESVGVKKTTAGYEATGKLTIKDVTKEIKLPFTFTKNAQGGVFAGSFTVIPKEYNVVKEGTPDQLTIQLNIPVVK